MPNVCVYPTKDALIEELINPNLNYGSSTQLYVDMLYIGGSKSQHSRSLLQFTIPAEVNAAEVYKAYLCLWGLQAPFGSADVLIHRAIRTDWVESEVTWNIYKTGSNWTTAGCDGNGTDYDSTEKVQHTMPAAAVTQSYEIEITTMVTDAITNHGRVLNLRVALANETLGTSMQFYWWSKDNLASPERRNYLNIIRPPFGLPMEV